MMVGGDSPFSIFLFLFLFCFFSCGVCWIIGSLSGSDLSGRKVLVTESAGEEAKRSKKGITGKSGFYIFLPPAARTKGEFDTHLAILLCPVFLSFLSLFFSLLEIFAYMHARL